MDIHFFRKNKKGSLTVEAAFALPIFMCVVLSLAFFIKVQYIQNNVQYALNQCASELSTYSYLYTVTGLQKSNDSLANELEERQELASDHISDIVGSFDSLSATQDDVNKSVEAMSNGDFSQIGKIGDTYTGTAEDVEKIVSTLKEAGKNPKKEFVSISCLLLNNGFQTVKEKLSEPLIKYFMYKYLDQNIFKEKGGPGAYVVVKDRDNVMESFDFSNSTIFKDNKTIDIIVRYKIKTVLPINILPEIQMEQRVTVRGWLNGDASNQTEKDNKEESIWDLNPFDYGKQITQLELKNYPNNYPNSDELYDVRSINISTDYYKDAKNIKQTISSSVSSLVKKKMKGITSKTLIVVIPEGTLTPEVKKALDQSVKNAKKRGITVQYKEGYGKPTNKNA